MNRTKWEQLERTAQSVLDHTIAALPDELRRTAEQLPCLLQEYSDEDPDLLGIYTDFAPGEVSAANGPIILYLAAIDQYCDEEGEDFEDQVRMTYLHELGHHFGWDEGDLEARGLI